MNVFINGTCDASHSKLCETGVWVPYQSFHLLMVHVHFHVCILPHCSLYCMPYSYELHMWCWLDNHLQFGAINVEIWRCGHCFAWPDSNNKPQSHMVEPLFVLCRTVHAWICASEILSVKFLFLQGKISLTNVSERKDKMRLGMTLVSNPKDSSFVVSGSVNVAMLPWNIFIEMAVDKKKKRPSPQDCLLIIRLHCWVSSYRIHLVVACINTFFYISGLRAVMVVWVWQLLLQHWTMLQS